MNYFSSWKNRVPVSIQKDVFRRQIQIVNKFGMPLILHVRDAMSDSLAILEECGLHPLQLIHFHCWMDEDPKIAFSILQKYPHSFLGFTNAVSHHRNHGLQQLVKQLPVDRMLLETDSPYFKCGRPYSMPQDILNVGQSVAHLKNRKLLDICVINVNNCKKLYARFPW